ncbi:hypothetical protein [Flavobacterium chungangense]|uniref:hypothetical protein n=1 Tax=Flavobacterium chungangense TaxID=554283 RepID=UPI001F2997D7|nr:hypothetical protein [Flavobacterium chungangense]
MVADSLVLRNGQLLVAAKRYVRFKKMHNDLKSYHFTIETLSEMQAEKYYDLLLASCDDLASNQELGRNYAIVTKGILGFKSG